MLRLSFYLLFSLLLLGLIGLFSVTLFILPNLPDIETLRDVKMQVPLRIYTHDDALISEFGEKRRNPIQIDNVPQQVIDAFLAAEDDRFYQHPGVDWQGIVRATINLIMTGKKSQGGSTITMQVARNFFLSSERSYLRKINEIFLALKIERELSKDEILELYLNKIYLGQRAYGVGAAAQVYYGSDINNLNLAQIAMIAGLPKAPSTTNPISDPERALERRNYVIRRMLEKEYITKEEFNSALATPISADLHSTDIEVEAPYVAEMVRRELVARYGDDAYSEGYKVYTTIRNKNQEAANHALRGGLIEYDQRHGYRGPEQWYEIPENADETVWEQLLADFPPIGELKAALVIEVQDDTFTAYTSETGLIDIDKKGFTWAKEYISENGLGPAIEKASEILKVGDIIRLAQNDEGEWRLSQIPNVEGGLVSLDPNNGATLALVGGFDFQRSKFNRITQAKRQPGSSFKPFIYSAALEMGYTSATLINDAPVVFDDPGLEDIWRPKNYTGKNYGPTRLRVALTHSRNLVSIRLLHSIGIPTALKHSAKFGFDKEQLPHNLSLALGSGVVTPWRMASAYSVFANGGYRIEPYFIERIESVDGEILFQANPLTVCHDCMEAEPNGPQPPALAESLQEGENANIDNGDDSQSQDDETLAEIYTEQSANIAPRVVNEQNIWIMNSMTRDVIQRGTGRKALVLNRPDLSGKTGTTNDQRDAWFAGFNPAIVTISWIGFDEFHKTLGRGETGSRAALPMWIDYMKVALEDIPPQNLEPPPGLINILIDRISGLPTNADNPDAFFEIFRSEYAPVATVENEEESSEEIPTQIF